MSVYSGSLATREKLLINSSYRHSCHMHDIFHVSQLKKCLRVPEEQLPMEELNLGGDLTYSERPIKILDMAEHVTHSKVIKMCKV
jgi:hypothetical protein